MHLERELAASSPSGFSTLLPLLLLLYFYDAAPLVAGQPSRHELIYRESVQPTFPLHGPFCNILISVVTALLAFFASAPSSMNDAPLPAALRRLPRYTDKLAHPHELPPTGGELTHPFKHPSAQAQT